MTKFIKHTNPTPDSMKFRVYGSDLFVPVRLPDGTVVYFLGDSFSEADLKGDWRAPVCLIGPQDQPGTFTSCIGTSGYAKQILPYDHGVHGVNTMLPTDAIVLDNDVYMHVMAAPGDLSKTLFTEVWVSHDGCKNWSWIPESKLPGNAHGGYGKMQTWCDGEDGYVYVLKSGWRDRGIILFRVERGLIGNVSKYEPWGYDGINWGWGKQLTPILNDVKAGEMCLRKIQGQFVLSYFRADKYCIEIRTVNNMTDNWYKAPTIIPVYGSAWGSENDNHAAQLYGGYIFPGSTLADMKIIVSQWKTDDNSIYRGIVYGGISVPDLSVPPVVPPTPTVPPVKPPVPAPPVKQLTPLQKWLKSLGWRF